MKTSRKSNTTISNLAFMPALTDHLRLMLSYNLAIRFLIIYIPLCIIFVLPLSALTRSVAQDGSQDYTSIQSAINDCNNGDTVMVYPGRYFENVVFGGKIITLCSLEAATGDSSFISTTIIDGNNANPCVRFVNEEQGVTLRGLTLEHGIGHPFGAQDERWGGGVFVRINCSVSIINCVVKNNRAVLGGGISAYKSSLYLAGTKVHGNHASASGGGIFIMSTRSVTPDIVFDEVNRCSVYENYSTNPCDIRVTDLMTNLEIYLDMVSVPNPGDFYFGRHANFTETQGYSDNYHYLCAFRQEVNCDIYVSPEGDDDNSGLIPEQAMRNIAKAIHKIAPDSTNTKTVHILPGIYTSEDQFNPMVPIKSHVNISGAGPDSTLLVLTNSIEGIYNCVVSGISCVNIDVSGIAITSSIPAALQSIVNGSSLSNSSFSNIVIRDLVAHPRGSIMLTEPINVLLKDIKVYNIDALEMGGIYSSEWEGGAIIDCEFRNIRSVYNHPGEDPMVMFHISVNDSLTIQNCIFSDIETSPGQTALAITDGLNDNAPLKVNITGCLFSNMSNDTYPPITFGNQSTESFKITNNTFVNLEGWPAALFLIGDHHLQNNVFYNPLCNYELSVMTVPISPISNIVLDYNNIRGGTQGIITGPNCFVEYGTTNISDNPNLYSLHSENPFFAQLAASSPCINAATPDTTGLALLPYDLAGNHRVWDGRIDMGCFEYGSESYVSNLDPVVPAIPEVNLTAYPNPFSAFTNIKVSALSSSRAKHTVVQRASITIYNIKGQRVKSIALDPRKSGEQITCWDARDAHDQRCSSGVYIVNLMVNGRRVSSKKVTLIR
ncbi:MAG: T9SS type A sorting domain-containing protein [Candidatus Cloacimonetes bacterium]|nr:T9SS type A sorting domain-containing protein [Candidatus Cloacimonadota bacterium]